MEKFEMNKNVVVQSPRDVILDGIIIDVNKTTWKEIIPSEKLDKFDNPDKELVQIKFETKFDERILKGEDVLPYFEKPMSNSNLGKFLDKYENLAVGKTIKIVFNDKGFGKIKLD